MFVYVIFSNHILTLLVMASRIKMFRQTDERELPYVYMVELVNTS